MSDRLLRVFTHVQEHYPHNVMDDDAVAAHVRWLNMECDRLTPELGEAAEDAVIEREIIGKLPPRLVHEVWNRWAYLEAEVTPPTDTSIPHDELSTLHWYGRAAEATVDSPEPARDPWDYRGADPIEDVTLPPKMAWSETDRKVALEKAVGIYGLEPGDWLELDWPPRGSLWSPGHVYMTPMEPCEAHIEDDGDDECEDCVASVRQDVEEMAQWKWITTLRFNEIRFDRDGAEYVAEVDIDQAFEVAITEQDPREILIGPPGHDTRW